MRLENLKNEIPETPDFIHEMIQNEVKRQLQDTKVVPLKTRKKWNLSRTAAVAAVCVLAASTAVYAGEKLYHLYLEKQGDYSVAVGIKADENADEMTLPKEVHDLDIFARYIPDGMEWIDEYHLEYPEHESTGGFSFAFALLDQDTFGQITTDENVVESEERTFGSYEGVYLKYNSLANDGSFTQRIYLFCPELYHMVTIYIGDDISKEDAMKVAENLVLTENDTILQTAEMDKASRMDLAEEPIDEAPETSIAQDSLLLHSIGETFDMSATGETIAGEYLTADISACVDSIQVADDLQLLDADQIPEEWQTAVDEDGKLVKNTLSYVKSGDGVNTLDEVVDTQEVSQKLVYATVTYTNPSDEEIDHMLYIGSLMLLDQENDSYTVIDPNERSGDGYDRIIWDGAARTAEMKYSDVTDFSQGNGGNYIPFLKPGESIQVHMAWIVNEPDLANMYLNLNGDGAAYDFSDAIKTTGLTDIRQ